MPFCQSLLRAATFAVVAVFATADGLAQSSNPEWLDDLEIELNVDHECEVAEFLTMHEGKLGGRNMYIAKVKCTDGRMFDAYKLEPEEEFSIKPCEIIAC